MVVRLYLFSLIPPAPWHAKLNPCACEVRSAWNKRGENREEPLSAEEPQFQMPLSFLQRRLDASQIHGLFTAWVEKMGCDQEEIRCTIEAKHWIEWNVFQEKGRGSRDPRRPSTWKERRAVNRTSSHANFILLEELIMLLKWDVAMNCGSSHSELILLVKLKGFRMRSSEWEDVQYVASPPYSNDTNIPWTLWAPLVGWSYHEKKCHSVLVQLK